MNHFFQIKAQWTGGLDGAGRMTGQGLELPFSGPKPLGGLGNGTNPEELLLGASSGCLLITLGTILDKRGIQVTHLSVDSQLRASSEKGLTVQHIVHRLQLQLGSSQDEARAREAIALAENFCPIAKALRGNVATEILTEFTNT